MEHATTNIARGTEVNIGVGGHGYRYKEILTGIRQGGLEDECIDPIPPQLIRMPSGRPGSSRSI